MPEANTESVANLRAWPSTRTRIRHKAGRRWIELDEMTEHELPNDIVDEPDQL
jgi:hypothetical protein